MKNLLRLAQTFAVQLVLVGCATTGSSSQQANASVTPTEAESRAVTLQIAEIMATSRMYDTAVPMIREGLGEDPNNPRLHRLMGIVLRDRGVFDQAMSELTIADRLDNTDPDTAAAFGVLYDQKGQSDAAEMWHRRALDIAPKRGDLYNNLGFSLYLRGLDHQAIVALREGLRYNSNQPRAFNNLGFALARLGHMELARQAFEQAGGRAKAMASLGVAHEMAGRPGEAETCYRRALKLDSQLQTARRNLRALADTRRQARLARTPEVLLPPQLP